MLTIKCPHCDVSFTVIVQLQTEVLPVPQPDAPAHSAGLVSSCSSSSEHALIVPVPLPSRETPSDSPSSCESFLKTPVPWPRPQSHIDSYGLLRSSGVRRSARIREREAAQMLDDLSRSTSSGGVRRSGRLKRARYKQLLDSISNEIADGTSSRQSGEDNTYSKRSDEGPADSEALCNNPPERVAFTAEVTTSSAVGSATEEGVTVDVSQLGAQGGWVEHTVSREMRNAIRRRRYGFTGYSEDDDNVKSEVHAAGIKSEAGLNRMPHSVKRVQGSSIGEVKQEQSIEQPKVE
ncbi:hypothetical protein FOL47_005456 [Perkinsus chesapeaki]|uniref:Uncharacterized protein n=1 Tax=Perkinsus chesapeaki TaxID=330153 RepID=A0A7J6LXM9_PERCH|nr:hypothetical protein FOL47_005456 [Perkinsus chesapeaki]